MKTQSELEEQYRKADLADLSDLYFSCEGASARRRHFESTWLAIGFQAQDAPVPDLEILGLFFAAYGVFRLLKKSQYYPTAR